MPTIRLINAKPVSALRIRLGVRQKCLIEMFNQFLALFGSRINERYRLNDKLHYFFTKLSIGTYFTNIMALVRVVKPPSIVSLISMGGVYRNPSMTFIDHRKYRVLHHLFDTSLKI